MQSVVEVGSSGFDTRLHTKQSSKRGAFLRWLRSITHLGSESLETTIGRAVEQAFAEFAEEMQHGSSLGGGSGFWHPGAHQHLSADAPMKCDGGSLPR